MIILLKYWMWHNKVVCTIPCSEHSFTPAKLQDWVRRFLGKGLRPKLYVISISIILLFKFLSKIIWLTGRKLFSGLTFKKLISY